MSQIVPLLLQRFKAELTRVLIDDVPAGDLTRAKVVKIGKFQDDPTVKHVYVSINAGDPEEPGYKDGIVTLEDMHRIGFTMEPREIGGGQMWWRRGIIQIGCYYILAGLPEETACEYAFQVLGRIEDAVERVRVHDLADEFGEQAVMPFLYANTFFESGGPPNEYIWRGKVYWSVLTQRRHPLA